MFVKRLDFTFLSWSDVVIDDTPVIVDEMFVSSPRGTRPLAEIFTTIPPTIIPLVERVKKLREQTKEAEMELLNEMSKTRMFKKR